MTAEGSRRTCGTTRLQVRQHGWQQLVETPVNQLALRQRHSSRLQVALAAGDAEVVDSVACTTRFTARGRTSSGRR